MLFGISESHCKKDAKKVVSEENGNKHVVVNPSQHEIYQYHIDGGIVTGTEKKRCDYIVEVMRQNDTPMVFVIELKGSDLKAAIAQINSTVTKFQREMNGYRIKPRIIIHKVASHDVYDSEYRKLKRKFPDVVLKCRCYEDNV